MNHNEVEMIYFAICLYLQRSRILPENFVPEYFEDGSRRYYYKGSFLLDVQTCMIVFTTNFTLGQCIRCREDSPAIFFSADNGEMAFALNYCEKCTIATTPGITNIRGNGRKIYDAHMDTPKHLYLRLRPPIVDPQRNAIHLIRGKIAQHAVKVAMKLRRNMERYRKVRIRAAQQDVGIGKYLSWGFGDSFDEYFGEVDSSDRPHGWGIKFYSDGSTYLGEWKDGQRHTVERKGIWSRPDGTTYEGTWQSDYKHGYGSMRYPDGANYDGEFAKGYEHGHGIKYGTDGNRFEGRFRFGKIDGPGCIFYHDGKTEKRVFREPDSFTEKPLPITQDDILDLHDPDEGRHHNTEEDSIMGNGPSGEDGKESGKKPPKFFQPDTLVTIAVTAVARTMFQYRSKLPSEKIRDRLQVFLKPRVARRMLQVMYPRGSIPFMNAAPAYAFVDGDTVALKHIPFRSLDTESLLYFIASNQQLRCLEMVNNRLDPTSLELVFKAIASGIWPNLEVIDLSFNKLDISILAALLAVIRTLPRIKALRLSGCKIAANGAALLAR